MSRESKVRTRGSRQKRKLFSLEHEESGGGNTSLKYARGEKVTFAGGNEKSGVKGQKFYQVQEVFDQNSLAQKYVLGKEDDNCFSVTEALQAVGDETSDSDLSSDDSETNEYGSKKTRRDLAGSLRIWAKKYNVHRSHVNSLLKILKLWHPYLPTSAKDLIKRKMPQAQYAIVEFLDSEVHLQGQLAVVPTHFVKCDDKRAFYTQYLNPPYSKENLDLLENIVRSNTPAPADWKLYKSKILKFNLSFEEAEASFGDFVKNKSLGTPKKVYDAHPGTSNATSFVNDNSEVTDDLFNMPDLTDVGVVVEVTPNSGTGQSNVSNSNQTFQIISSSVNSLGASTSCPSLKNGNSTASATKADLQEMQQNLFTQLNKLLLGMNVSMNSVNMQITNLDQKITNIQKDVSQLKVFTMGSRPQADVEIVTLRQLSDMSGFTFPFAEKTDFLLFDSTLKDEEMFNKVRAHFIATIDNKQPLNKVVTAACQKFFRGEVLRKYTATKKIKDKDVFKETNFYTCLKEALMYACPSEKVDDQTVTSLIGTVINNCVDWHGNRMKRQKSAAAKSEAPEKSNSEDWHGSLFIKSQKISDDNVEENVDNTENVENMETIESVESENSKDFKESN